LQNQFFISGLSGDDTIKNRVLEALYRRILRAEKEKKRFRVIIVIPLLPGFQVIQSTNYIRFGASWWLGSYIVCFRVALMMVELHP
jgi:hypothetical protein